MNKTMARKMIKAQAWANMAGNWFSSLLVMLIEFFIVGSIMSFFPWRVPSYAELLAAQGDSVKILILMLPREITAKTEALLIIILLLVLLVLSPFAIGKSRFFLKVGRGEKAKIRDVFSPFTSIKTVFSSVGLQIMLLLLTLLWAVLLMLAPFAVLVVSVALKSVLIMYIAKLLIFVAAIGALLITSRYNFAVFIFAEDETKGAIKSLGECIRLLRGRTAECIKLRASYFFFDIMSLYVPPFVFVYQCVFMTVYGKYLSYFRNKASFSEEIPPEEV